MILTIKNILEIRDSKVILILRRDKGCGTVILDREKYDKRTKKIYAIINNTFKFKKLPFDPVMLREAQLKRYLRAGP